MEGGDGGGVDAGCVGVCAVGGRDVDGAPGGDAGDDGFAAVLEELGEVCARGVALGVPEAGDCCDGLARVVEGPAVDGLGAAGVGAVA